MRFPDWPQRLDAAIEVARSLPFAYGTHDCCLFAADVVLAVTGEDHAAQLRGTYTSEQDAQALLEQLGGLEAFVRSKLGEPIHVAMAGRGDIMLADAPPPATLSGLGVCIGLRCAFADTRGLAFIPRQRCRLAWKIS
ncbi:MAG TPA: hypothetical protein VGF89_00915 [Steroidobacteraceae bacterium]|jgi:hypothetical protein